MKYIACDLETKGGGSFGALEELYCLSWCHEGGHGVVELHWTADDIKNDRIDRTLITNVIGDRKSVWHNAQFDVTVLRNCGIELPYYHCTQLLGYCVNPNIQEIWVEINGKRKLAKYSLAAWGARLHHPKLDPPNFDEGWTDEWIPYALNDALLTWKLWEYLKAHIDKDPLAWTHYDTIERPYMEFLMELNDTGLYIDEAALAEYKVTLTSMLKDIEARAAALHTKAPSSKIYEYAEEYVTGDELYDLIFIDTKMATVERTKNKQKYKTEVLRYRYREWEPINLNSPIHVKYCLEQDGHVFTELSKAGNVILDKDALADIDLPFAKVVHEYRTVSKLLSTYVKAFENKRTKDGYLYCSWNQTVCVTGRLSSSAPNLQNVPAHTQVGMLIRKVFTVPNDDYIIIDVDLSNIEYRVLAALEYEYFFNTYGQVPTDVQFLIDVFLKGEDIHTMMAKLWGVPRGVGKNISFGRIFGFGPKRASMMIGCTLEEAKALIAKANETNPSFEEYRLSVLDEFRQGNGVGHTLFGRRLFYPEIMLEKRNIRQELMGGRIIVDKGEVGERRSRAERQAFNAKIQGTAADILKVMGLEMVYPLWNLGVRFGGVIHDECIMYCPRENADAAKSIIIKTFNRPANTILPAVPVSGEVKTGESWAEAKLSTEELESLNTFAKELRKVYG